MEKFKKILEKIKNIDKKKRVYFIIAFVFLVVMLWAFLSASFITAKFSREQAKTGQDDQKVDAVGIIITETKDGNKYFEIYGEDGNYNSNERIAVLNNVIGNFYKDNKVSMSFQSSKGTYDEEKGTVTLHENTYIVLENGTSLSANSLVWSGSDKDTIAEGNVKIKKDKDMVAIADKCIISAGYDKFKIVGKTQTNIYGKEGN